MGLPPRTVIDGLQRMPNSTVNAKTTICTSMYRLCEIPVLSCLWKVAMSQSWSLLLPLDILRWTSANQDNWNQKIEMGLHYHTCRCFGSPASKFCDLYVWPGWLCLEDTRIYTGSGRISLRPVCYCSCYQHLVYSRGYKQAELYWFGWMVCSEDTRIYIGLGRMSLRPVCCFSCYQH